ncbi:pseudouridine synthase [Bacteriovorax sp. DB6_IX]|uniref:pseudouridine synthase n=1 Tax=Bacteriovorax sp. DB6_IX TaxID=1353530 RepID=UPI00038A1F28|nr:pseudouridine synthase [Bacteriovorax sp. DB6_IX]EQC51826.1 RNA pseudouridine synthase [Bacteriovorax sp. DB6_IX]
MSESQICILIVKDEDKNQFKRLDQFLAHHLKDHSRSFIKDLFLKGQITSETKLEIKRLPAVGTEIKIEIPPPRDPDAQAENIPLEIIYEDEHLVFVNKPAGMVTHPAPGNYTGTLVNAILHHCPDLQGVGDQRRPGIVHRLDKGTSGIMVVAKNQKCHDGLVKLFSTHDIDRVYEALVMGTRIEASGRLESTIGRHPQNRLKMAANVKVGKNAITYYKALGSTKNLVEWR